MNGQYWKQGNSSRSRARKTTALPVRRRSSFTMQKLIVACGSIVICFFLLLIAVQWIQQRSLKNNLLEKEVLIESLEKRNQAAREEIEHLQDLSYIETLARKYFGLVKPGEITFQVED